MNNFKEEVCKLIQFSLSTDNFYNNIFSPGYKEIFVQFLRQYPGISTEGVNTWQKVELYLKHHKITQRAAKVIENFKGENNKLWKELHYEHIFPISLLIKELVNLGFKPKFEDVKLIMQLSEVIILSKEEANLLDGSMSKQYPLDGKMVYGKGMRSKGFPEERLKAICAKIDKRYSLNKL